MHPQSLREWALRDPTVRAEEGGRPDPCPGVRGHEAPTKPSGHEELRPQRPQGRGAGPARGKSSSAATGQGPAQTKPSRAPLQAQPTALISLGFQRAPPPPIPTRQLRVGASAEPWHGSRQSAGPEQLQPHRAASGAGAAAVTGNYRLSPAPGNTRCPL